MSDKKQKEYIKKQELIVSNNLSIFIYEVSVYIHFKNLFFLANSKMYSSKVPITNIVQDYWKNKHIQICCNLYSAPEKWLLENDYKEYVYLKKR